MCATCQAEDLVELFPGKKYYCHMQDYLWRVASDPALIKQRFFQWGHCVGFRFGKVDYRRALGQGGFEDYTWGDVDLVSRRTGEDPSGEPSWKVLFYRVVGSGRFSCHPPKWTTEPTFNMDKYLDWHFSEVGEGVYVPPGEDWVFHDEDGNVFIGSPDGTYRPG